MASHWIILRCLHPYSLFLTHLLTLSFIKCVVLRDLVPFVQFKKLEKHPWRSVTFSKACNFTKSNSPLWVFFTFLKLFKWYQIAQSITCIQLKFLPFLSGTGEVNNILLECPLLVCRGIFT